MKSCEHLKLIPNWISLGTLEWSNSIEIFDITMIIPFLRSFPSFVFGKTSSYKKLNFATLGYVGV